MLHFLAYPKFFLKEKLNQISTFILKLWNRFRKYLYEKNWDMKNLLSVESSKHLIFWNIELVISGGNRKGIESA